MTSATLSLDHAYPRLQGFVRGCAGRLGVPEDVRDDVVQEVFLTWHRKGCRFENEAAARAWLSQTARRVASNDRRGRRRRDRRHQALPSPPVLGPGYAMQAAFAQAWDRLALPSRRVLELSCQGFAVPEIARRLGLNPNAASARLRRARQRVASVLVPVLIAVAVLAGLLAGQCATDGVIASREAGDDRLAVRVSADASGHTAGRR
jgi:RNA polymerase sigma-70 factor (ECF subfamily)